MDSVIFVEDLLPAGCLFAQTIRSPVSRGTLREIRYPRLPVSFTLIRGTDIPGKNELDGFPVPVLASSRVSYAGEPVAILVGPDMAKLEDYAARCGVIVDEEAPEFSAAAAGEEGILAERRLRFGDPEGGFSAGATVIRGVYATGIQEHGYAEPHGAVADFSARGEAGRRITVHTATQWPFHVKRSVAALLKLSPEQVAVVPTGIGSHLDGKIWYPSLVSCHAALASFITKKPVKLVLTREEDFRFSPKRNAAELQISSALGAGGELLATEIRVTANLGAQGIFTDEILDRTCLGALGVYKYGNVKLEGFAARTNIPPQGPLSGFGLSQGFFAMERHISRITDTLRLNPAEWRKNNFLRRNGNLAIGVPLKEPAALEQLLDTAAAMSGYYRKWASYELLRTRRRGTGASPPGESLRGIGIALAYQGNGFLFEGSDRGAYTVELTLEKDGSLEIRSSMVSSNPEYLSIWRKVAVEILAVDPALVRIRTESTEAAADSGPSTLSRNTTIITRLMELCCQAIRKQRFRDPLPITVRRTVRPDRAPAWGGNDGGGRERSFDRTAFSRMSWGAAVVEVEIDPVSYVPKIRGAWLGIDGGKLLSEERARRSLKSSVVQALGWASREELAYEGGLISPEQVHRYDIPSPAEIPPVHVDFVWNDAAGSRGLGEIPFSCVPAAYVQAVSQAMDHHFEKIPLTARDIWDAGKTKGSEAGP
jgi:CO/xanthine dehydrogenase Mo-binding subunit